MGKGAETWRSGTARTRRAPFVPLNGRRAIRSLQLIWSTCSVALWGHVDRILHGELSTALPVIVADPSKFELGINLKRQNSRSRCAVTCWLLPKRVVQ
jgi:hypothetical protein